MFWMFLLPLLSAASRPGSTGATMSFTQDDAEYVLMWPCPSDCWVDCASDEPDDDVPSGNVTQVCCLNNDDRCCVLDPWERIHKQRELEHTRKKKAERARLLIQGAHFAFAVGLLQSVGFALYYTKIYRRHCHKPLAIVANKIVHYYNSIISCTLPILKGLPFPCTAINDWMKGTLLKRLPCSCTIIKDWMKVGRISVTATRIFISSMAKRCRVDITAIKSRIGGAAKTPGTESGSHEAHIESSPHKSHSESSSHKSHNESSPHESHSGSSSHKSHNESSPHKSHSGSSSHKSRIESTGHKPRTERTSRTSRIETMDRKPPIRCTVSRSQEHIGGTNEQNIDDLILKLYFSHGDHYNIDQKRESKKAKQVASRRGQRGH